MTLRASEGHADHGIHIPRWSGTGRARIHWLPATNHVQRARTWQWTCECKLTVYYLMHGGGRAWIRRVRRVHVDARPKVVDTDHLVFAEAELLWELVLLGRAK